MQESVKLEKMIKKFKARLLSFIYLELIEIDCRHFVLEFLARRRSGTDDESLNDV